MNLLFLISITVLIIVSILGLVAVYADKKKIEGIERPDLINKVGRK